MQEGKKKKLLVTASTFPRFPGDTEPRFVLDLAKELQKYYQVTVLVPASPDAAPRESLEGVSVERYRYFPIHKWETLCYPGAIVPRIREKKSRAFLVPFLFLGLFLALFQRRRQYDYVHAHWLIPQGIVQSFFKTPYLLTGHGGDVTSLNSGIFKALKKRALKKAAAVTVVSQALRQEVLALFSDEKERQLLCAKLSVQPMGCDTEKFRECGPRPPFPEPGARRKVLFVGRLAEKKGVKYLIRAMQWVEGELLIVGEGPLREALQKETAALGLTGRVRFLGAKNHRELPRLYREAHVFAAPSVTAKDRDKEGFGLVILEAMASGLPVVASRSGGITELITDGWNGLLTEEKDSRGLAENINRLFTDREFYSKLVENMKETVRQYDYVNVGKAYADLLSRIPTARH